MLSFITLNTKTWAYELISNLKTNLNEHYVIYQFRRTTKSYHSQTCFRNILTIDLNKKLNFCYHILERNVQMHVRLQNLVYYNNLTNFKL